MSPIMIATVTDRACDVSQHAQPSSSSTSAGPNKIPQKQAPSFSGWNEQPLVRLYFHASELQRQGGLRGFYRMVTLEGTETIIDYGCGDGKITSILSHHLSSEGGRIVGVDISKEMVVFAGARFPTKEYPNLCFVQDPTGTCNPDYVSKAIPAGNADVVMSSFAFHLVPDPATTLSNVCKMLKKGGKMAFVLPTTCQPFAQKHTLALRQATQEVISRSQSTAGWVPGPEAVRKLNGLVPQMEDPSKIQQLLKDAGFTNITIEFKERSEHYYGVDEMAMTFHSGAPAVPFIQHLSANDWRAISQRVVDLCPEAHDPTTGVFAFNYVDLYVSAIKA